MSSKTNNPISKAKEKLSVFEIIYNILTNPFVMIFGSMFVVMMYGALTNDLKISILSLLILPIGTGLYAFYCETSGIP